MAYVGNGFQGTAVGLTYADAVNLALPEQVHTQEVIQHVALVYVWAVEMQLGVFAAVADFAAGFRITGDDFRVGAVDGILV